ncbi:MAG TPA: helix-turn-helix domain-containing protein [Acidimicrobiales bacterium]
MASTDDRLTELEARVAALEGRSPAAPVEPVVDPEVFWALAGLRERVPAPGGVMIVGDVELPGGSVAQWQEGALTADLLDDEWERTADALAALGHPVRLQLLRHVLRGLATARELAEVEGMGTSGQVYHHLRQLVAAGWLRNRGSRYEVPPERVVPLLATMIGGRR